MSKNSFSNPSRRPSKSAHSRSSAVRATGEALAPARKHSGKGLTPFNILAGATALGSFFYATAHPAQAQSALPQGGTVVGGDVSIAQPSSDTLNVVQGSNSAIVNWQSFNVGSGNTVNFQQPGSSSVILNRVVGNDPSAIFGTITANGTVMLVNPNGVVFGKGSRVDVGGLVATTANIRDADFMSGNYNFDIASANPSASIVNAGDISIRDAGLAALVAPNVQNAGVIHARLGKVALGGAKTFSLDFHGDGLLSFGVGSDVDTAPVGTDGNPVDALVSNSGSIIADGGVVSISARAVKDVIDNVINTSGVIQANSVSSANGRIILSGGDNGTVVASGSIKAAGDDSGETGGSIVATGEKIAVASGASMDASGDAGGGLVAIGSAGDGAKGRGTGAWSNTVSIAKTASLKADAITSGDGGTITVLSETLTNFAGSISAKGGATGGNGGFAEVSSHKGVKLTGTVDLTALNGETGTFLLDPDSLTIIAGDGTQDTAAGDGTVSEGDSNNGANTISAGVLEGIAGTTNIVLEASGLITVSTTLNLKTTSGHSVTLRSTGQGGITFSDSSYAILTSGGDIVLQATSPGASITNIGNLISRGGDITVLAARDIELAGTIRASNSPTSGAVVLNSIAGSIFNKADSLPELLGKSVKLSTGTGNIGASSSVISVNADDLEINVGGSFFVNVSSNLASLNLTLDHLLSTDTQTYLLTGTDHTFELTDTADAYVLTTLQDNTKQMNFTFSGEKSLTLGTVNVGTGDVSLTANKGAITGAEGGKVTANALTMTARDGISGLSSDINGLSTDVSALNVTTETGGIYISNTDGDNSGLAVTNFKAAGGQGTYSSAVTSTGNLTVGHVTVDSGTTYLKSDFGIFDDGNDATSISAEALTLRAKGAIGTTSHSIVTSAKSLSLAAVTGIYFDAAATSGTVTFSNVQATSGDIKLTTHTSTKINDIGHKDFDSNEAGNPGNIAITVDSAATPETAAFLDIDALDAGATGDVTLSLTNGYVNADSLKGDDLVVSATVLSSASDNSANNLTTTVNTVDVTTSGNSKDLVIAETDALTVKNVQTGAGTSSITIGNQSGDLTIAKIDSTAAVSLNAAGGAVVALDGNSVKGTTLKLAANGAIGSSEQALYTYVTALDIDNTGNIYIQNINSTLTSLVIKNAHDQNQSANVISLTSDHLAFAVSDDATSVSLNKLTSANLETVSFETDSNLVVGQIGTANASVSLTAGGNIADDGNANTRIVTSGKLSLSAQKAIGTSSASVEVIADDVTLNAGSDVYFRDISDLDKFSLTLGNADSEHANLYAIEAQGLEFALSHNLETGYHLDKVFDLSGLTFGISTDADLSVGALDVSYSTSNSIILKSTGAIKDDGESATNVLANSITLSAGTHIGDSDHNLSLMAQSLSASANNGGIYIDVKNPTGSSNYDGALTVNSLYAKGDISLIANHGDVILAGQVKTNDHNLTLTVEDGSLLGGSDGSINAGSGSATVNVTSGDIGRDSDGDYSNVFTVSAAQLDLQAGGSILTSGSGAATIAMQAGGASASYTLGNGDLTVKDISVASGAGALTLVAKSGSINRADVSSLDAAKLVLDAKSGSIGNILSSATDVALTAANGISFTSSNTLTKLSIDAKSTLADDVKVGANGQSFAISSANSVLTVGNVTGGSSLDFSFTAVNDVVLGQVALGSGKADIKTSGSIFDDGDHTNTKVTAGSVSLTAGSSGDIGADGNAIDLDTAKLSVSAGGDIRVFNTQNLTHLAVTSTNASTSSTKVFDFGAGSLVTLTDEGDHLQLGVENTGNPITDFSLTTAKDILVGDVYAEGTVTLETTSTGQYSNISQSGSDTKIEAGKVVLKTGASNKTYGAIGTADQALVLATSDLSITSKGSIYIDNSNTALTGLTLDLAHVDSNNATTQTYSFTNIAGTTVTLTDNPAEDSHGAYVELKMTSTGDMDFALSMDRQITATTITAGTSSTGSVSLTTTGQASGQNEHGSISATSITAGSITLNSYESVSATTTTQNLSINSSYEVNVTNNATLDSLKLDLDRANVDQGDSSRNITYSISSTGLTFSDVTDNYSGTNGLLLGNITQSGLDLEITAAKTVTVTKVDVGTGKFTLNAGENTIRAVSGNTVITADELALNGASIGTSSSDYFTVDVNKLSGSVKNSVMLSNSGDLAVSDLSVTSDDGSINLKVTNGNLTGVGGTNGISARDVYLQVANGDIGVFGNAVTTNARNLTIEGGSDIYLTNASDLFALNLTANHKDSNVNSYDIRAHGLTLNIKDAGSAFVTELMDDTGINFDFSSDRIVYVGELNAGAANSLSITATGSGNYIHADIGLGQRGSSFLSARSISLTSKGSIGTAGDQFDGKKRIQTTTKDLTLNTHANVYVDNKDTHLASLSLTSDQETGGEDAPVYILTSSGLTFDVTDNGTTNVNQVKDADAGLIFDLNTKRAQVIGTIDAGLSGSVTLTSPANITGADINHITAGTATFTTKGDAVLGSAATPLNLTVADLSTNTVSDIYLINDRLLSNLAMTTNGSTDAKIRIVGAPNNPNGENILVSGLVSSANGTEYTTIDDNTGLTLSLTGGGDVTIKDINLNGIGELTATSKGGSLYGDNAPETTINAAIVNLSSDGSVGTSGKTIYIEGGELTVSANTDIDIALSGRTNIETMSSLTGDAKVANTKGDVALGKVSMNGGDFYFENTGGSILSGSLSNTAHVTLIASGSIGNVSAISMTANGNGTTTLDQISATTNDRGATGSVNIAETYGLTVTSVSATSDVTLSAGTSETSTRTLTTGNINAGTATVSLTSGNGAVVANPNTLITAGKLIISATSDHIGSSGSGSAVKTTATALDLRAPGDIYVESGDLSSLSIDRSNDKTNSDYSTGTVSIAATNLTWSVSDGSRTTTMSNVTDTTGLDFTYKAIEALQIGTINTGENGSVTLSASYRNPDDLKPEDTRYYGDIVASSSSSSITAGSIKLTAQGSAAAIGSSETSLKIDTKALAASSQSGGINVTNASALALNNITTSGDLSVTISSGDLTVGALSYGSGKNLTLTASDGYIYTGVGKSLSLNSGNISLSASDGIGSTTSRLQLSGSGAGEFTANVTGTGSIYLNAQNGMSNKLVAKTANGAIDIVSNGNIALTDLSVGQDAVGNDIIVLAKSGNITIGDSNGSNGVVAGANNGKINLTAQNGAIYAGNASSALGAFEVRLTGANGVGTVDNAIAASGQRVLVSATNAGADVYLRSAVDGTFSSVSTNGGDISIKGSNGATILVASAVSGAGSASTAGNITISTSGADGNLILGNINAKGSSSDGQITLTSTNGSVVDDDIDATRIVGSSLEVNAGAGVGTTGRHLSTTVARITGDITAGDVFIDDNNAAGVTLGTSQNALSLDDGSLLFSATNAVTLTNVVAKKDGETIDVTAGDGDISVNSVLAGATSFDTDTQPSTSTVKLKATNGSILSARSDNSTVIMAGTLSLDAKNNVGALTWEDGESGDNSVRKPLQVIIKNLEATMGSDGSVIAIRNGGTDTLSLDKINGQAMTSVMVYSQGDITWGDAVTGRTLDKLMLSTSGTLTLADTVSATAIYLNGVKDIVSTNVDPRKLTLEATGASGIQIYSGSQGGTTTLNSTAKALDVQLLEGDTKSALVVSNTGALTKANLSAYNDVSLTNDVGVSGATITTNGENHTARITATTGDVTVGTINSGQTGTVALTATQGAIKFDGDQSVVTANVLTLTSFTGIGTEEQSFSTDVNTLNATVTGTGNIYTSYKANSSTGHLETHDGDIYVTGTSSLDVDLHHVWLEDGPNNESRKLVVTVIGGDVALSNALNGGNTVASLEVTAANISTDALTTGGSQSYTGTTTLNGNLTASAISINGNAILGANTMTLASTNGGDVKITGSVTGKDDQTGTALAVNAGAGDVGVGSATSHISQIALTGGNIMVGNVTTTGTQTYTGTTTLGGGTYISGGDFKVAGATLLGASTTVNTSSNNSNVTFDGAVDSDGQNYQGLEINSGYGTINFNGALGGTRLLTSIVLTSTSSQNDAPTDGQIVFASAANVNVYEDFRQNGGRRIALPSSIESEIGDIKIDGDAYLKAGASSIKALNDNEGGLVRFLGTITGNGSQLTVNAASAIEFNGAYADNAQGSTLALTAPNITVNAVTTKGAQSYTGATRILNNLTAGSIQIDGAASLAAQIVTFGLPETQTTTFDTSAANGNITLTGTLDGGSDIVVMKAGTGAVSIAGAATNVNNMTVSGGTISVHDVTTTNAQDYTGVTTLNGTYQVGSDFTVTGASWIDDDTTINTQDGTLSLKGTVNSVAHADLTLKLNGGNTTTHFDYALGNTNALGMLTINAGENGVTEFARTANISVIDGLVYTGGLKLLLPANITASNGPIKLGTLKLVDDTDPLDEIAVKPQSISGVIATLPSGNVTIRSGDDITIAGLIGKNTNLVMTSGTGDIRIGSKEGTSDQKIDVKSLNVATARTANLYGTIGGITGFDASYEIGPLKFAPYYINDAFWRNRDLPPAATKTTPLPKPPSTPQVDALFNLNTTSTGITPNVVGAFAAPTVLNVGTAPTNLSVAPSPTVITTPVSGSTGAGVVVTPPSGSGGIAGGNGAASSGGTATGDGATGTTTEGGDQPGVIGGQSDDTDLIQSNDQ
ncbi:filamentous hemagglutinin N-terminal domain-containing protein [Thalassospira sp.]|uniref:filamentous hemagglutinin N-terminal domain-containing protein n=1 Tax=Thalassospira sp. TaxID=1912094 RepID=UPI003AA913E7